MFDFLKSHPFPVEAFFERSVVLTFAVPKEQLESLLPSRMSLDTFDNKWGFLAVALVHTKKLRPKGFPMWMGNDFFLVGYRVFVRYTTKEGKNLRGLYILKSETDKLKMQLVGNFFTHYNYKKIAVRRIIEGCSERVDFSSSSISIEHSTLSETLLPQSSPFQNWKEARRFAGPLPFTFTYNEMRKEMLIVEGVRSNWKPSPAKVTEYQCEFLDQVSKGTAQLASAFSVENVPYFWKKGKIERWD